MRRISAERRVERAGSNAGAAVPVHGGERDPELPEHARPAGDHASHRRSYPAFARARHGLPAPVRGRGPHRRAARAVSGVAIMGRSPPVSFPLSAGASCSPRRCGARFSSSRSATPASAFRWAWWRCSAPPCCARCLARGAWPADRACRTHSWRWLAWLVLPLAGIAVAVHLPHRAVADESALPSPLCPEPIRAAWCRHRAVRPSGLVTARMGRALPGAARRSVRRRRAFPHGLVRGRRRMRDRLHSGPATAPAGQDQAPAALGGAWYHLYSVF